MFSILLVVIQYCIIKSLVEILSLHLLFFFKQKTAYELRISDWSSDVCSSDLPLPDHGEWACASRDSLVFRRILAVDGAIQRMCAKGWALHICEIDRKSVV